MKTEQPSTKQHELNAQEIHWERTFARKADLFGTEPEEGDLPRKLYLVTLRKH